MHVAFQNKLADFGIHMAKLIVLLISAVSHLFGLLTIANASELKEKEPGEDFCDVNQNCVRNQPLFVLNGVSDNESERMRLLPLFDFLKKSCHVKDITNINQIPNKSNLI